MIETPTYNITIYKGTDYAMDLVYAEDNETPADLTGWMAEAQLREFPEDNDAHAFTCSVDGTGVHLTMDRDETAGIGFSRGAYDVLLYDPMHSVRIKMIKGKADIKPGAAR